MNYNFDLSEDFDLDTPLRSLDGKTLAFVELEYTTKTMFTVSIYSFDGDTLDLIEEVGCYKSLHAAQKGLRASLRASMSQYQ